MMKTKLLLIIFLALSVTFNSCGQSNKVQTELKTEIDTVSYAIGISFGQSLMYGGLEDINPVALAMAIQDMYEGKTTIFDAEGANMLLNEYFSKLQFSGNLEEGERFLSSNSIKTGVVTTESGVQYEVTEMGTGRKPVEADQVVVHYTGTLIDGTVFDSSYDRGEPAQFRLDQVIPGWTEALQLMPVGSKWTIYIPQHLAYGATPRQGGPIEPYMALIFEVELLDIIE